MPDPAALHRKECAEDPISEGELEKALDGSGYKILSVSSKPYEKKKLFSFGKK